MNIVSLFTTKFKQPDIVHGEQSFWQERGQEYVDKFFAGVRRHLSSEARLLLLTDTPEATPLGVETLELPKGVGPGWWAKLALFKPKLLEGKTLYMDLDNVVCGPLEPLLALEPAPILMCDDVIYPGMPNASMFLCYPEQLAYVWKHYGKEPEVVRARYQTWPKAADQAFLADEVHTQTGWPAPLLQHALPRSYLMNSRVELENAKTWEGCSVVFGSANPKPHMSLHPFYAAEWRT